MKAAEKDFRAGAGTGTIRFDERMFPLEGFCRVHDAPHVRALIFGNEELAAILSVELVFMPEELIDHCKKLLKELADIPENRIWVQVTNAISTPHAPDAEREKEKRALYDSAVKSAVSSAVNDAAAALSPAKLGIGLCVSDVIENRDIRTPEGVWIGRNGYGPTNRVANILRFEGRNGQLLALLINFAMKSAVLDNSHRREGRRQVSADAAGYACATLEKNLGAPVLYSMSAAGDQVTQEMAIYNKLEADGTLTVRDLGVEAGLSMVRRIGSTLAMDVLSVANGIECDAVERSVLVADRAFPWQGKVPDNARPRRGVVFLPGPEKNVDVSVMRLGPAVLVACKPEVNCITELQLRAHCPAKHTLLLTMVNGGIKYMPDKASYNDCTWEALSSPLMPGAAEKFVQVACDLAAELNGA